MDSGTNVPSQQGQKEAFLNGLSQFLADKGKYLCKEPKLAGKIIDLHDLYNRVTSAGGYQKVTDKGFWEDFLEAYGFKVYPVTLAYGLQKVYQSYLEEYEKVHFFGDDEANPLNRGYAGYRRYRYTISDSQRIANNMNVIKPSVSNYDRVVLSLESCLPNEIDFAVNACTLLSGESRHVLRLPQCPRIVDALLLHAGIVSEGCDSYKSVLAELQDRTNHDFEKFWQTSVLNKSVLPILLPSKRETSEANDESSSLPDDSNFKEALEKRLGTILFCDPRTTDSHTAITSPSRWPNLFHGHRSLGVQDYEGQRVLQIALVLLNLSFEDFNVVLLARHSSLLRFVFLCVHSQYSCLRQTGLDILSNISSHIELHSLHCDVAAMVFDTVHTTLMSDDKFERIRGCEILGNICRCKGNGEQVSISVREDAYEAAVRNLLISDIELLLSALEALYRLSKLGETTCTKILFVHGSIDTLICLVTLNVRTFGPEKLSEIRLARRISPLEQQVVLQQQYPTHVQNHTHNLQNCQNAVMVRQVPYQPPKTVNTFTHPRVSQTLPVQPTPVVNAVIKPQLQQTMPMVQPVPQTLGSVKTSVPDQAVVTSDRSEASAGIQSKPALPPQSDKPDRQSQLASPPPQTATPATSEVTKTPPGAGAMYTHSETGTVPPVFHYIPAPPSDITNDKSPEAFTKLWIWATYESDIENYIPRVDVYCEYLASSNRYGRQGKSEVLSATDFGKCLKQIFPQATSRLFNQGRGQPQYHIAGIKKRPTPFPVPGHQLKDSVSVFSSDSDHAENSHTRSTICTSSNNRNPVAVTTMVSCKSPIPKSQASIPSASTAVPFSQVTSVPIQQLQFRQVQTNTLQSPATTMVVTSTLTSACTLQASAAVTVSSSTTTEQDVQSVFCTVAQTRTPKVNSTGSNCTETSSEAGNTEASSTINEARPSKLSNSEPFSDKTERKGNPCKETNNSIDKNSPTVVCKVNPTTNGNGSLPNGTEENETTAESCKTREETSDHTPKYEPLVNGVKDDGSADEALSDSTKLKRRKKSFEDKHTINGYIDSDDGIESVLPKNLVNGQDSKNTDGNAVPNGPCVTGAVEETTSHKAASPVGNEIRASLHERIKDTITRRKNVLQHTPTTVNTITSSLCTTPVNTTLPPSVIQQYSYRQSQTKRLHEDSKENPCGILVQQIIPITPQQLQHQYAQQRQQPGNLSAKPAVVATQHQQRVLNQALSTPVQVSHLSGHKRLFEEATPDANTAVPSKVLCSSVPMYNNSIAGPDLQQVNITQSSNYHHTSIRPGQIVRPPTVHTSTHLIPHLNQRPPIPQQLSSGMTVGPNLPSVAHHQHPPQLPANAAQQKAAKPPTIDLMAPNASLLVLYRNVGKIPFVCPMDEKEDAISKSVRLTSSLILTNIARYSNYGRSLLQRHEGSLASVALSQMDCSPIIARLLSELDV